MEATFFAAIIAAITILGCILILGIVFRDFFWFWQKRKDDESEYSPWYSRNQSFLITVGIVFVIQTGCTRSCLTETSSYDHYNSDGFNEVTGEYNNQYQGSEQQQKDLELIDQYSHWLRQIQEQKRWGLGYYRYQSVMYKKEPENVHKVFHTTISSRNSIPKSQLLTMQPKHIDWHEKEQACIETTSFLYFVFVYTLRLENPEHFVLRIIKVPSPNRISLFPDFVFPVEFGFSAHWEESWFMSVYHRTTAGKCKFILALNPGKKVFGNLLHFLHPA